MRRMYSKPQLLEAVEQEAKTNGIKVFEDIKDKNGNPRFIEGNVDISSDTPEGITKNYGKWSLSGTHLLIVYVITIANNITLNDNAIVGRLSLPSWVYDNLVPVIPNRTELQFVDLKVYNTDTSIQSASYRIIKGADNTLSIRQNGSLTTTKERQARIAFDFLIDNN